MSVTSITVRFKEILKNKKRTDELRKEIFAIGRYEDWIAQFYLLADTQFHAFQQNQSLLNSIFEEFTEKEVSAGQYEELLECTNLILRGDSVDPGLAEEFLEILIPYYERINDVNRLLYLYQCAGFVYLELSRMGETDFSEMSVQYYEKVISYRNDEKAVSHVGNVLQIILGYYNLLIPSLSVNNISFQDAYEYWKTFEEFLDRPFMKELIKEKAEIKNYVELTLSSFPKMAFLFFKESKSTEEQMYPILVEIARHWYFEVLKDRSVLENPEDEDLYTYHCLCVEMGTESPERAFWIMDEAYHKREAVDLEKVKETNISIELLINPILRILFVLNKTNLQQTQKQRMVRNYCQEILRIIEIYNRVEQGYLINTAINSIVTNKILFEYIESPQEKAGFLLRLTTLRQISTMIHSRMVAKLVENILTAIYEYKPELLIHTKGMKNVEEVLANKEAFLEFAREAALVHDIGKNAMIDVINTNHRRLTDIEAIIIQKHPKSGCEYLKVNPAFEDFHDIVLGHHKFYDGSGGYENTFDNTKSEYRFLIDLVTVCDCMDAATDYLGRNFRNAKTFDALYEELKKGAGTRYNPDIVAFVGEHRELYREIKRILGPGRTELYFKIFQEFSKQS